jgi:ProP effector
MADLRNNVPKPSKLTLSSDILPLSEKERLNKLRHQNKNASLEKKIEKKLKKETQPQPKSKREKWNDFLKKRRKALQWLFEKYPLCFKMEDPIPLKIGIHADILAEIRDDSAISKTNLRKALRYYVGSNAYKQAIISHTYRCDLNGNEAGEVSEQHKLDAQKFFYKYAQTDN